MCECSGHQGRTLCMRHGDGHGGHEEERKEDYILEGACQVAVIQLVCCNQIF